MKNMFPSFQVSIKFLIVLLIIAISFDAYFVWTRPPLSRYDDLKSDIHELRGQLFSHRHRHEHNYSDQSLRAEYIEIIPSEILWEHIKFYWRGLVAREKRYRANRQNAE